MKTTNDVTTTTDSVKRTPWMGGLTKEDLARPGGMLLAMLTSRANDLGHQLQQMAEELGCTYGYISQLRSGVRQTKNISDEFAKACAYYLGVPRMTVLLAAGRVLPEDVLEDTHEVMASVPRALKFMEGDPKIGPRMPRNTPISELPLEVQYFIVELYEMATDRKLLPGSYEPSAVAEMVSSYSDYRERMRLDIEQDRQQKSLENSARRSTKTTADSES